MSGLYPHFFAIPTEKNLIFPIINNLYSRSFFIIPLPKKKLKNHIISATTNIYKKSR